MNGVKIYYKSELEMDLPRRSTSLAMFRAIIGFIGKNEFPMTLPVITDAVFRAHSS